MAKTKVTIRTKGKLLAQWELCEIFILKQGFQLNYRSDNVKNTLSEKYNTSQELLSSIQERLEYSVRSIKTSIKFDDEGAIINGDQFALIKATYSPDLGKWRFSIRLNNSFDESATVKSQFENLSNLEVAVQAKALTDSICKGLGIEVSDSIHTDTTVVGIQ